jgi:hypothetical protein
MKWKWYLQKGKKVRYRVPSIAMRWMADGRDMNPNSNFTLYTVSYSTYLRRRKRRSLVARTVARTVARSTRVDG